MPSAVSISNEALAEIGADAIASLNETSKSATECNRVFDNVVADILSRIEPGFAVRRVTAASVTATRPAEWIYAYTKPADAATVMRVLEPDETSYPEWGIYDTPIWQAYGPLAFIEEAGTIYTNVQDAVLEYQSSSATPSSFPPLFRRAVALELAVRVCYPIKKDRGLRGDMIQLAEVAAQRAIAEDRNRYPHQQQEYVGDVELARAGLK